MTAGPALLLIDVQMAFLARREAGQAWANPEADRQIAALIAAFRAAGLPVVHVHHHDLDPDSDFRAGQPGAEPQPCAAPRDGEPVFIKSTSSAFIGTGLEESLRARGLTELVIAGGATNYCVESTTRMAGDLGFKTTVAGDALINFDTMLRDGRIRSAEDVLEATLSLLDGEFATVRDTRDVIAALP